jgi:hypothetical protein
LPLLGFEERSQDLIAVESIFMLFPVPWQADFEMATENLQLKLLVLHLYCCTVPPCTRNDVHKHDTLPHHLTKCFTDYFNILTYFSKELHVLPDDDHR